MVVFASLDDFEAFVAAAESRALRRGPIALAAGWLALIFEPATKLLPSMRREAMEHGWPVHRPDAYPLVECGPPPAILRAAFENGASRPALRSGRFRSLPSGPRLPVREFPRSRRAGCWLGFDASVPHW